MKTVLSRKDLRNCTEKYVLVTREDLVYIRAGDEYVIKAYFDTEDAMSILEKDKFQIHRMCKSLGIQARANKGKRVKITLNQLRQMANL